MVRDARREICVQSHRLDAFAYGGTAFLEAVKHLVLGNRRARVRILVNEVRPAAQGHRLVDLGRALSSFMEFRHLAQVDRGDCADRVIVDAVSCIERLTPDSLDAKYNPHAPSDSRRRMEGFEHLWERAQPSPEFRDLWL